MSVSAPLVRQYYRPEEAVEILRRLGFNISLRTVYRRIADGTILSIRIRGTVRIVAPAFNEQFNVRPDSVTDGTEK